MPNWTRTTYVFYAQERAVLQDFHDKLVEWAQPPTLFPNAWDGSPSWLGNILAHAGFDLETINDDLRYRGSLTEVDNVEQNSLQGTENEAYHYFTLITETAWREMPKMWRWLLDKLYQDAQAAERIDFAFLAEEETYCFVHAYNPRYLQLICIDEEMRFYILSRIGEDFSKALAWQEYQYEASAATVADALAELLDKQVSVPEVEDGDRMKVLLDECNARLKAVNLDYYFYVVPIGVVSEDGFE